MEKPVSQGLKTTFLIHALVSLLFGLGFWIAPGRFLTLLGWVPATYTVPGTDVSAPGTVFVDPFLTRGLGAALLALAFASFQGWRERLWAQVALLVRMELVFCLLGTLGLLASLVLATAMPLVGWVIILFLAGFGAAWFWAWRSHA